MFYEGINFNTEWAANTSLKEFMEHEQHHGISDKQLKEVHRLCKAEQLVKNPPELTRKKQKYKPGEAS